MFSLRFLRLLNPADSYYTKVLKNSKEGTMFRKLYETKREDIPGNTENTEFEKRLNTGEKTAYFLPYYNVFTRSDSCSLYSPYVDRFPWLSSIAMDKGSPYYQFFQVCVFRSRVLCHTRRLCCHSLLAENFFFVSSC